MQKPNNYDNTQASGSFTPIETGGHHLIIKQVQEAKSKKGKDMVVVIFDTAPGDRQPSYFSKLFAEDIRPEKKWPRNGRQYIVVEDDEGNCSKSFKSFINSVEKSNSGFTTQWGDKFAAQFKGKRIGGVFGEVENEYNGKVSMRKQTQPASRPRSSWLTATSVWLLLLPAPQVTLASSMSRIPMMRMFRSDDHTDRFPRTQMGISPDTAPAGEARSQDHRVEAVRR